LCRGRGETIFFDQSVWVALSSFTGEVAQVLDFDLQVQGFGFTNSESAHYVISGNSNSPLQVQAIDRFPTNTLFIKTYSGSDLRHQAHAIADDFVNTIVFFGP
jgi:hypothetical protein